ncbi:MAG: polysaccharide deacetylase family protein [Eggerthellaceae bacterium]
MEPNQNHARRGSSENSGKSFSSRRRYEQQRDSERIARENQVRGPEHYQNRYAHRPGIDAGDKRYSVRERDAGVGRIPHPQQSTPQRPINAGLRVPKNAKSPAQVPVRNTIPRGVPDPRGKHSGPSYIREETGNLNLGVRPQDDSEKTKLSDEAKRYASVPGYRGAGRTPRDQGPAHNYDQNAGAHSSAHHASVNPLEIPDPAQPSGEMSPELAQEVAKYSVRGRRAEQKAGQVGQAGQTGQVGQAGQAGQADANAGENAGAEANNATASANQKNGYQRFLETDLKLQARKKRRKRIIIAAVLVLIAALVGAGFFAWSEAWPISITVNGQPVELQGPHTLDHAVEASGVQVRPGNFVDVTGETIEEGHGYQYTATINGDMISDTSNQKVSAGDKIELTDGASIEEPYTSEETTIAWKEKEIGNGPIHAITQEGKEGKSAIKTGQVSGKKSDKVVVEQVQDKIYNRYYPNVGSDKVVALTFDDGPWTGGQTAQILDTLKENDAKATFFVIGDQIVDGEAKDLIKRESDEGHQVCTHSWDHASGSGQGVSLDLMSKDERRSEIQKGRDAIGSVLGGNSSSVIRAPGGNFKQKTWKDVEDLMSAEIGWNIDTRDWNPSSTVSSITEQIESADPGDIILMHDGGGDRSKTIAALKKALPYLKEKGYRFITMDELIAYGPKNTSDQEAEANDEASRV